MPCDSYVSQPQNWHLRQLHILSLLTLGLKARQLHTWVSQNCCIYASCHPNIFVDYSNICAVVLGTCLVESERGMSGWATKDNLPLLPLATSLCPRWLETTSAKHFLLEWPAIMQRKLLRLSFKTLPCVIRSNMLAWIVKLILYSGRPKFVFHFNNTSLMFFSLAIWEIKKENAHLHYPSLVLWYKKINLLFIRTFWCFKVIFKWVLILFSLFCNFILLLLFI